MLNITPIDFVKLKRKPFHILLLPVFYVLHVVNAYYGLFPVSFPLYYLSCYLLLAISLYVFSWLILRSATKAGIWTIIVLIIFLFFGKAYDLLISFSFFRQVPSFKILLVALFIFVVLFAIFLKRTRLQFGKANTYFNLVFIFFVVVEIGQLAFSFVSEKKDEAYIGPRKAPAVAGLANIPDSSKPDIFFIVFDEYTSSSALKTYFHFDNSQLDSSLSRHGFYQARSSQSNYNFTPFSLASTLDFDYINMDLEHEYPDKKMLLKGQYQFSKSHLPVLLKKEGYTIKNIGVFHLPGEAAPYPEIWGTPFYVETIWYRAGDAGNYLLEKYFPKYVERKDREEKMDRLEQYRDIFSRISGELKTQTAAPKFVYGHILLPHDPFMLNRKGEYMNTALNYQQYSRDSLYLEQLAFCNTWIDSLVKASDRSFKRPRVVIIEGDHGFRDPDDNLQVRDRNFMNLSAYYFSDKNYSRLYDSISPVNSFRVILNKYFHTYMPMLKDSTIFLY